MSTPPLLPTSAIDMSVPELALPAALPLPPPFCATQPPPAPHPAQRAAYRCCCPRPGHFHHAFKMDVGGLDALAEIADDVAVTKSSWDRYAEFLKERNEMANRDWLSMRDQVRVRGHTLLVWAAFHKAASKGMGAADSKPRFSVVTRTLDPGQPEAGRWF
eukprot:259694-Chlamydomonas_euryale.AAC.3